MFIFQFIFNSYKPNNPTAVPFSTETACNNKIQYK